MRFEDLLTVYQTRIEDFQIQAHVIMPPTPDRIKFDIFDRVNRGGTILNKQEIRNALYQGNATAFLNRIVETQAFRLATGNAFLREKRMKDKYIVRRFISLYLYKHNYYKNDDGELYIYKNDIDELLGKGMESLNSMPDNKLKNLEDMIIKALLSSVAILGGDAFRLVNEGKRGPINMNIFESIMFDIRVKLATKHILHLSHLSIDIILEATATTIVQFEQKDILQLVTFVFIYI